MAKKKKIKFDFEPSEYQLKIFDWVEHGCGNAVIKAAAGSGKTFSAIQSIKLIPKDNKILFIAFNKSIADELTEKLKNKPNISVRTTHSLGLLILKRNLGNIEIDEYKYRKYLKNNILSLTTTDGEINTKEKITNYLDSITMLIDYSRLNLAQTEREINNIATKYSIPVSFDECLVAKKCLDWGKKNTDTVDFADMLWLPIERSLKPIGVTYDWVFFDEAQDASICSSQLMLKCIKRGGRFVAIGDPSQMVNLFAGASEEAFNFFQTYPNTQIFDLPISYRCAKNIVNYAKMLVPFIKSRNDAPDGIIIENCHVRDIKEGDMVLCRTKAPLVNLYVKLLRKNINCYIKGNDIGLNLIKTLESVNEKELNVDLESDGVFVRLYDKLFNERNKLIQTKGLDFDDATLSSYIMEKYDALNALTILAEKFKTKDKLIEHIKDIFSENRGGICLSTVHKAKGLEAENVYIICHSSMPSKLAVFEWEKKQEENIRYVAYTRAKTKLGFVSEKEVKASGSAMDPELILKELIYIEQKVCQILGKEPMKQMDNTELAKFKIQNIKTVEDIDKKTNETILNIGNATIKQTKSNLLLDLEALF